MGTHPTPPLPGGGGPPHPQGRKAPLFYHTVPTVLGWVGVLASPQGLRRTTLPCPTEEEAREALGPEVRRARYRPDLLATVARRLQAYLRGEEASLNFPLDLEGAPPFLRAVWEECRRIPVGETRSYSRLAEVVGRPGAARAVGQAVARNPLPLVVPCHRVVGKDGDLRGYGGGRGRPHWLGLKAHLLALEARMASSPPAVDTPRHSGTPSPGQPR